MNLDKSLYEILLQTTNVYPKNYAICFENKLITYQKLLKEVDKLAEFLHEMNVKEKDIVTVSMPNMPMSIITKFGLVTFIYSFNCSGDDTLSSVLFRNKLLSFSSFTIKNHPFLKSICNL